MSMLLRITYAESVKYDEQFALHCDNMLNAYNELLKTLVVQLNLFATLQYDNTGCQK